MESFGIVGGADVRYAIPWFLISLFTRNLRYCFSCHDHTSFKHHSSVAPSYRCYSNTNVIKYLDVFCMLSMRMAMNKIRSQGNHSVNHRAAFVKLCLKQMGFHRNFWERLINDYPLTYPVENWLRFAEETSVSVARMRAVWSVVVCVLLHSVNSNELQK